MPGEPAPGTPLPYRRARPPDLPWSCTISGVGDLLLNRVETEAELEKLYNELVLPAAAISDNVGEGEFPSLRDFVEYFDEYQDGTQYVLRSPGGVTVALIGLKVSLISRDQMGHTAGMVVFRRNNPHPTKGTEHESGWNLRQIQAGERTHGDGVGSSWCVQGDRGLSDVIGVGERVVQALGVGWDGICIAVFDGCEEWTRALYRRGFTEIATVPGAGSLARRRNASLGPLLLVDSHYFYLQLQGVPRMYPTPAEVRAAFQCLSDAEFSAHPLPSLPSLPTHLTIFEGRIARLRVATYNDCPFVFARLRAAWEAGTGYSAGEFFGDYDIYRSHIYLHATVIIAEEDVVDDDSAPRQHLGVVWASPSDHCRSVGGRRLCELGVLVDEGARGRGVGRRLLQLGAELGTGLGYSGVLNDQLVTNDAMTYLHTSLGYRAMGVLPESCHVVGQGHVDSCLFYLLLERTDHKATGVC